MDWKHARRRRLLRKWRRQQAIHDLKVNIATWIFSVLVVGGFWAFMTACILSMPVE